MFTSFLLLPMWAWLGLALTCLLPASLMYDLIWGLVGFRRVKWYLLEAALSAVFAFLAMAAAGQCGLDQRIVAVLGCCGCSLPRFAAMIAVGTEGLFTREPQLVPEWWVWSAAGVLFPLFLLDVMAPILSYGLVGGVL